jgi:MFS family permease
LAASFAVFLAVRLFHGLGWSATTTAAGTIATDAVPKSRLAEGMGYFGLTSVLAMAVAPTFGLTVMNHFNFAVVCYTSLSLAFLAMLIALFLA